MISDLQDRANLYQAYYTTIYRIDLGDGFVDLTLGRKSIEILSLMKYRSAKQAAYLTAYNPRSYQRTLRENNHAQIALVQEIEKMGKAFLPGRSIDSFGLWPAEESYLVFDIDFPMACHLSRMFDQEAFIFIGSDAVARLSIGFETRS